MGYHLRAAQTYLEAAKASKLAADRRYFGQQAVAWLREALGEAKRSGNSYAAGRILTAIREAHKVA
jgi:hypothetical protein